MAVIYESEGKEELTTLLDVARAISSGSYEMARPSKLGDVENNEVLALTKLLDDNGKANKTFLEILKDTPMEKTIKKYLGLTENDEQKDSLIVDRSRRNPSQFRRIIVLNDESDRYQIVRFEKPYEQPYEVDVINAEDGDKGFSVNPETARELDKFIDTQKEIYENYLEDLVEKTF